MQRASQVKAVGDELARQLGGGYVVGTSAIDDNMELLVERSHQLAGLARFKNERAGYSALQLLPIEAAGVDDDWLVFAVKKSGQLVHPDTVARQTPAKAAALEEFVEYKSAQRYGGADQGNCAQVVEGRQ